MKAKSMIFRSLLFLLTITACPAATGKIIYVDDDATGANDGSSWQNAYTSLQDALADAETADKPAEIHVAHDIYKPDKGAGITHGDKHRMFHLINGVAIMGGYVGLGETNPNARDIEVYENILSGGP